MKEHHEYNWTSVVTGEPTTLALDISADDDHWHPSMEVSLELHGITYRNSPIGLRPCGEADFGNLRLSGRDPKTGIKEIVVKVPGSVLTEMNTAIVTANTTHISHMLTDANLRYEIHSTDGYGVHNGFNELVIAALLNKRLDVTTDHWIDCASKGLFSDVKRSLNAAFHNAAQASYTPFPEQDGWTGEYLAYYREMVANHTAPGVAYFKASDVVAEIDRILVRLLPAYIEQVIEYYRQIAASEAASQRKYTPEQAAEAERQYNDIHNEGGEGFVPHIVSSDEAEHARRMVSAGERANDFQRPDDWSHLLIIAY